MTYEPCGGDPPCWSHLFEDEVVPMTERDGDTATRTQSPIVSSIQEAEAVDLQIVCQTRASLDASREEPGPQPSSLAQTQDWPRT